MATTRKQRATNALAICLRLLFLLRRVHSTDFQQLMGGGGVPLKAHTVIAFHHRREGPLRSNVYCCVVAVVVVVVVVACFRSCSKLPFHLRPRLRRGRPLRRAARFRRSTDASWVSAAAWERF